MLREYQEDCTDAIYEAWDRGVNSVLGVLATGLGKTVIISEVIKRIQPARTIVLAHRDTLIYQARDTIREFTGLECEIEMADQKANDSIFSQVPVIISTIQTQNAGFNGGRMKKFSPNSFGLLVGDEAHHFPAPSFKKVVDYYFQNYSMKMLGMTATPDRADNEALGQIFKETVYEYDIIDGIMDGWLVPIDQMMIPVQGLDYSHIETTAGDLNLGQLSEVMEDEDTVQRMIQPTLEVSSGLPLHRLDYSPVSDWASVIVKHGKPRRTLVFCASVIQAQRFAEIMNRVKPGMAAAVWDKVPKGERRSMFEEFKNGTLQVLVNVGICTEGFDCPEVEVVVMARATKSRSLYTQIIGRGTRPLRKLVDGIETADARKAAINASYKKGLLVCDFVGNSGRHKLITVADILGGRVTDRVLALAKKKALEKEDVFRVSDLLEDSEEIIKKRIERAKRDAEGRRAKIVARSKFTTVKVDPFDAYDIQPARARGDTIGKKLSEKQQGLLRRAGINPDDYEYPQAKQLFIETMRRFKNRLAGPGTCVTLKKFGYETTNMTKKEADRLMNELRSNNWQVPPKKSPIDPDI